MQAEHGLQLFRASSSPLGCARALDRTYSSGYTVAWRSATVSSDRWNEMGASFLKGRNADAARWKGLGEQFQAGLEASSARWSALGATYLNRYEAGAAASSARYQALAETYASTIASE